MGTSNEEERLLTASTPGVYQSPPRWMWYQLTILAVGAFLVFTAFSGVQNLESTLTFPKGVSGTTAIGILYGVFSGVSLLGPSIVGIFGAKNCLVAQTLFLGLFVAATWIPRPYTLYVAGALAGIGAPAFWVAQGVYVAWLAAEHAAVVPGTAATAVVGTMQGAFFGGFQLCQISGNLISSFVLHQGHTKSTDVPSSTKRLLFLVYIGCAGLAVVLMVVCLRRIRNKRQGAMTIQAEVMPEPESAWTMFVRTLALLVQPRSLLLLPLFFASGFQASFAYADLTAVVSKSIGEYNIGFVMCCYGACDALGSVALGRVSDRLGRAPLLVLGWAAQAAVLLTLLLWDVPSGSYVVLFVLAGLFGIGDAVSQVMISSLCSVCFEDNNTKPAFALFRCCQSLATAIFFFLGTSVSLQHWKTIITLASLSVGTLGYFLARALFRFDPPKPRHV
eukprot:m.36246 g.36246  ORF g.36246 m.36246 type:complete len:447 (-) comp11000_c0_seq2:122-1462(-)